MWNFPPLTRSASLALSKISTEPVRTQVVIGVKAKMYPVDSADIINRIALKHKDKNGLLKFIKSTTREKPQTIS